MRTRFAALFVATLAGTVGHGQSLNDMMFAGDKAYMMMPPTVASEGQVERLSWSSDGRYLVSQRALLKLSGKQIADFMLKPPPAPPDPLELFELRIEAYDVETQNRRTIVARPGQNHVSTGWVARRPLFLAFVQTIPATGGNGETILVRYDAANGVSTIVWRGPFALGTPTLFLSPTQAIGFAIFQGADGPRRVMAFDADFRPVGALTDAPDFATSPMRYWTEDGARLVTVEGRMDPENRTYARTFRAFAPRTMTWSVPTAAPKPYSPPATLQANVFTQRLGTPKDRSFSLGLLTAADSLANVPTDRKEPDSPGIVDVEVERIEVSPTGGHVAYTHKGIAMVRQLVEVPRTVYEQARDAAARTEALSKGKQCALALIMFATDNDDKLPSNKGDWAGSIMPYLKNASILEGFVYTYSGGFMSEIGSPATQEIGYVNAPGGRAIVYADGHVKFVADGGSAP